MAFVNVADRGSLFIFSPALVNSISSMMTYKNLMGEDEPILEAGPRSARPLALECWGVIPRPAGSG